MNSAVDKITSGLTWLLESLVYAIPNVIRWFGEQLGGLLQINWATQGPLKWFFAIVTIVLAAGSFYGTSMVLWAAFKNLLEAAGELVKQLFLASPQIILSGAILAMGTWIIRTFKF